MRSIHNVARLALRFLVLLYVGTQTQFITLYTQLLAVVWDYPWNNFIMKFDVVWCKFIIQNVTQYVVYYFTYMQRNLHEYHDTVKYASKLSIEIYLLIVLL